MTAGVRVLNAGTNRQQGQLENISLGITGAVLGGVPFSLLTGQRTYSDWSIGSFVVAVIGAVVPVFILRLIRHGRTPRLGLVLGQAPATNASATPAQ